MPPIEMTPLRPVGAIASNIPRAGDARGESPARATQSRPTVTAADALDPGTPPIDAERITAIRKAVESGSYPVIPARVADAMIAAGFLLRSGK